MRCARACAADSSSSHDSTVNATSDSSPSRTPSARELHPNKRCRPLNRDARVHTDIEPLVQVGDDSRFRVRPLQNLHGSPPARVKRPLQNIVISLTPHRFPRVSAHRRAGTRATPLRAGACLTAREPFPSGVRNLRRASVQVRTHLRGITQLRPVSKIPLDTNLRAHPFTRFTLKCVPSGPGTNGLRQRATSPSTL